MYLSTKSKRTKMFENSRSTSSQRASAFLTTPRADATEMVKTLNVSGSVFGVKVKEQQLDSFWTHLAIKERINEGFRCVPSEHLLQCPFFLKCIDNTANYNMHR